MSIKSLLKDVRKITDSESFATSELGIVKHWISTGDLGLNRIISGDCHKGIPSGRIIILGGESQSGKSLIAAQIAANALNENGFDMIFYFDSEGGGMKEFFAGRGADPEKIEHIPLDSVEDATVKILNTYAKIQAYKKQNPDANFLCILDSLGALVPTKLITDAEKGKQKSEMGGRAKLCNNLMKGCIMPALKSDTSLIVVNHIYDNPAAMFTSKIKTQGGGKGSQYASHVTIQCHKKFDKDKKSDSEQNYQATILRFFITKNRMAKPFYETEMFLDFGKGPLKYYGLWEPAIKYGFIESPKQGYYVVPSYGEKMFRAAELLKDDGTVWNTFLPKLNEFFNDEMSYSGNAEVNVELMLQGMENIEEAGDSGEDE